MLNSSINSGTEYDTLLEGINAMCLIKLLLPEMRKMCYIVNRTKHVLRIKLIALNEKWDCDRFCSSKNWCSLKL